MDGRQSFDVETFGEINRTVWDTDELVQQMNRLRKWHSVCDRGDVLEMKAAGWTTRFQCDEALYGALVEAVVPASIGVVVPEIMRMRIMDLCTLRFGTNGNKTLAVFEQERKRLFMRPNTDDDCRNVKKCLEELQREREGLVPRHNLSWPNTVEAEKYISVQQQYIAEDCPKLSFYNCEYAKFNMRALLEIKAKLTEKELKFLERTFDKCPTPLCRECTEGMRAERRTRLQNDNARTASQPAGREDPRYVVPGIVANGILLLAAGLLIAFGLVWRVLSRSDIVMLSAVIAISSLSLVFFSTLLTGYDRNWAQADIQLIQGLYNRLDLLMCFLLLLFFLTHWTAAVCADIFDKPGLRKAVVVSSVVLAILVSAFTVAMIVVHSLALYKIFSLCTCAGIDVSLQLLPTLTAVVALLTLICCFVVLLKMRVRAARLAVLRMTVVVSIVTTAVVVKMGIMYYVRFGYYAVPRTVKFLVSYTLCDLLVLGAVLFIIGASVVRSRPRKVRITEEQQPLLERYSMDKIPDQYQV